jgi:hypothetical protein
MAALILLRIVARLEKLLACSYEISIPLVEEKVRAVSTTRNIGK